MNVFSMAARSLRQRPLSSALTTLSVALGVALMIAVLLLEREARQAYRRTAVGVEVLVGGNKGSRIDTLLSALYHIGRAPGRVSWSYFEKLRKDPRVRYAVPLAVGDSYRGRPVVGTTADLFTKFEPRPHVRFDVDPAEFGNGRAVAGARTGLSVGDTFQPSHGGLKEHAEEFRVAAVARATGTAHDKAIWIDLRDFWHIKGHEGIERDGQEHQAISAILVKTESGSPLVVEPLIKAINDGNEAQAIRPVQVVGELFSLVGDAQRIVGWIAVLVLVVAALSVMVALYNTMAERRREIAVLRALGATRVRILLTVLLEAAFICAVGALCGMALGHGGAALAAPMVEARTGVRIEGIGLLPQEPMLLAALFGVGCVSGLVPALRAYRVDVVRGLWY